MNRFETRTNPWGIDLNYKDAFDKWHDAGQDTIRAILDAMGAQDRESPPQDDPVLVLKAGDTRALENRSSVHLESGETTDVGHEIPPDLPLGYHWLHIEGASRPKRLIVSPGRCFLPDIETWGWSVQLYAARSQQSWGIGDFADLETLARWSAGKLGAAMMLINPLSAATPILPQQPSPYYPASRRFFNPLSLHIDWIAEMIGTRPPELESLAQAARTLNDERLIKRDSVFPLKMRALELLWSNYRVDDSFRAFQQAQGLDLDRFATFCALAEHHNGGWQSWPEPFRHPQNEAVAEFARRHKQRVDFHKWLQWLIDLQLARCSRHLALMQDLPIGVDPDGADAWAWQDIFAKGMSVGAPPDEFNTQGQNWGLPPFDPHKLRAAAYEPFIQTIRAAFRNGGGLRIDHVMGLFRLYWIPQGMAAQHGTYVRYNSGELLSIVALESHRARAYVVGEDLGTVENEVRDELARHQIMSYRLLWFEKEDPRNYPRNALAAITTHDLPTVAGLWTGSDLAKQNALGLKPNGKGTAEIRKRLQKWTGLEDDCSLEDVIVKSHALLARAPARILSAALDDAAAVQERPNFPATTSDQNPNWSLALPVPIERLLESELPARIAAVLSKRSAAAPLASQNQP